MIGQRDHLVRRNFCILSSFGICGGSHFERAFSWSARTTPPPTPLLTQPVRQTPHHQLASSLTLSDRHTSPLTPLLTHSVRQDLFCHRQQTTRRQLGSSETVIVEVETVVFTSKPVQVPVTKLGEGSKEIPVFGCVDSQSLGEGQC